MKLSKTQKIYLENFETHPYAQKINGVIVRPVFGNQSTEEALIKKGLLEEVNRDSNGKLTHVKLTSKESDKDIFETLAQAINPTSNKYSNKVVEVMSSRLKFAKEQEHVNHLNEIINRHSK